MRLAAYFVQGRQSVINIEDGVLQPLRHNRSRGLLKFQHEIRVLRARFGIEIWRKTKEQYVTKKIEGRFFHGRIAPLRGCDGLFDNPPVFLGHGLHGFQVRSVNWKTGNRLAYRARERLEREIAVPPVLLGKPVQHVSQHIDIVGQGQLHNLQFFCIQQMAKRN